MVQNAGFALKNGVKENV